MFCFSFKLLINSLGTHLLNYTTTQTDKTRHRELRLKRNAHLSPLFFKDIKILCVCISVCVTVCFSLLRPLIVSLVRTLSLSPKTFEKRGIVI